MRRLRRSRRHAAIWRHTAGFTLMEVLLTALLSAMLMAGLWSLFGTYLKLFETGQSRVERAQLVRAMTGQLSDDLSSLVSLRSAAATVDATANQSGLPSSSGSLTSTSQSFDAVTGTFSAASSTPLGGEDAVVPQFSLIGDDHTLRLNLLQTVPLHQQSFSIDEKQNSPNESLRPRSAELRSVLYSFEPPRQVSIADREPPPGLIRRELTWEETQNTGNGFGAGMSSSSLRSEDESRLTEGFSPLTPADLSDFEMQDDSLVWTREVIALDFRYFDGESWSGQWNSQEQKTLPVALEVSFQLQPADEVLAVNPEERQAKIDGGIDETEGTQVESNDRLDSVVDRDAQGEGELLQSEGFEPRDAKHPIIRQVFFLRAAIKPERNKFEQQQFSTDSFSQTSQ